MSRVIEVAFTGDPQAVVDKARSIAERHGAVFRGDRFAGTFSGNGIEGNFRFGENVVVVTIVQKPELAPWPMVETAIRGFFESSDPEPAKPEAARTNADGAARRWRADRIIKKHVLWASGAGLIPVPIADLAAVTAVQISMLEELSKVYEAQFSEPILRNFVTALTGGMLARIGASAIKAIPGIGTLLGGASMSVMSGASTYAVGQVAIGQLEDSGQLSKVNVAEARSAYDKAFVAGKAYVTNLKNEQAAKPDDDVIGKLERLGELRAKGVLTEEEFQAQKTKLLGDA